MWGTTTSGIFLASSVGSKYKKYGGTLKVDVFHNNSKEQPEFFSIALPLYVKEKTLLLIYFIFLT